MAGFSDYGKYDALGLAELIRNRDVSAGEVLNEALARADRINPKLNAITRRFDAEAKKDAESIDRSAPFAGVPFLLKDLHLHRKGDVLTNGSRLPVEASAQSSVLYDRYCAAGLVSFGRTASPEWGLSTATESSLSGQTRNPWNLEHSPGGSSGGAAAAVAAGIVPVAHASDGGGSVRIPASACGLFGLKPSRGSIPAEPHRGEGWNGMSASHVVSVSVRDSAKLFDATAGAAPGAPYAAPDLGGTCVSALSERPKKLRIGLITTTVDGAKPHEDCRDAALDAAKLCESLGHVVEEADWGDSVSDMRATAVRVISISVWKTIAEFEARTGRSVTEADVETGTWYYYQMAKKFGALDLARGVDGLHTVGRKWAAQFDRYDMVLTPTLGLPPVKVGDLDPRRPMREVAELGVLFNGYCMPANVTGRAAMSVPLYWNKEGLPIGAHFFGHFGGERSLFRLAAQLEEARPWAPRLRALQATL